MADIILILGKRGCGKTTLARRLGALWPGQRRFAHDPMAEFPDYEALREEWNGENIPPGSLVLADEVDLIAGPNRYSNGWIRDVVHYGRHLDITLIGCARRPANVHRDLSALSTRVYLGQITEPRDLEYCESAWGESTRQAATIPPFRFIEIKP